MIDVIVLLVAFVLVVALGLALWRGARGPATSRTVLLVRVAVLSLLVAPPEAYGAWTLMNAPGFQVFGRLVERVETSEPVVALTIDDGPGSSAPEVLKILDGLGVKATFFVNGNALDRSVETAASIVAAGHELGNHAYSHSRLIFHSQGFLERELTETDELIRQAGHRGTIHFRPPHGKKLFGLPYYLARTGRMTVMADVQPDSHARTATAMVRFALDRTTSGSIVLLHALGLEASRDALPDVVVGLRQRGYRFVTISELLTYGGS
jgi:peptidoglycan/xylan/chitin deacetylase (PgdA/CDA1 family)